jgi:hypothetical protein
MASDCSKLEGGFGLTDNTRLTQPKRHQDPFGRTQCA